MAGKPGRYWRNLHSSPGDLAIRFVSQEIIECFDSELSQILLKCILFSSY
jgi:hypothetical protein